jgi:hypothetical protein
VSRFVITIAPDNADADHTASAQTTVRVDTSSGQTRITELTVRAADGGGLAPADLPAVDLELLIRALAAPPAVRPLPAADGGAPPEPTGVVHFAAPAELTEQVEPAEVAAEPAATAGAAHRPRGAAGRKALGRKATGRKAPGRKAAGRKATGRTAAGRNASAGTTATKAAPSKTTARKAAGRAAAKAAATKATGTKATSTKATRSRATGARPAGAKATAAVKATGRGRKAAAAGERETRAYRRMPDPAEVLAAYAQAGSITGLAQRYGVPRHTANGWARRLRREGHSIGRS